MDTDKLSKWPVHLLYFLLFINVYLPSYIYHFIYNSTYLCLPTYQSLTT